MKNASIYSSSPVLVWLCLVTILVGTLALANVARVGIRYDGSDAQGRNQLSEVSRQPDAPQMSQFTAVQPGRRGVTEQPGRRGTIEQPGQSGADPDLVGREPMPPS